jgi:Kef-type K+ transport system membrane component KefB
MSRSSVASTSHSSLRSSLGYGSMIAVTVGAFLWICARGEAVSSSAVAASSTAPAARSLGTFEHLLIALAVVIFASQLLGAAFRYLKSPPVIGEIVAGILLGPSLLGLLSPDTEAALFPASIGPGLSVLSQIGVVLYMFLVGLEVDIKMLRTRGHAAVAISHASIVVPFLLGALLSLFLYSSVSSRSVPFAHFALFCGTAMSVTAFPVLARILSDRREQSTKLGVLALTCAAVDDVTAWCLLALVVSVVGGHMTSTLWTVGLTLLYLAVMWLVARPLIARIVHEHDVRGGIVDKTVLTAVVLSVLVSALTTELIGIHALFGAFAAGVMIPADSRLAAHISDALSDFVVVLFLPAFFAYTGLRTQIGLLSTGSEWLLTAAIIATACIGKFGGTFVAARFTGMSTRDSAALGALMNTRGLMELVVLNIGLDLKVVSPTLFAMMVIMAVLTTFATTPLLHFIQHVGRRGGPHPSVDAVRST